MKKTRHTPNQIITKLRKVEAARAEGRTVADAVRDIGVTEQTYYRWKREYGTMGRDQLRRLKDLEKENKRLKKLVADLSLDKDILKEALEGTCCARPGSGLPPVTSRRPWASVNGGPAGQSGNPDPRNDTSRSLRTKTERLRSASGSLHGDIPATDIGASLPCYAETDRRSTPSGYTASGARMGYLIAQKHGNDAGSAAAQAAAQG